MISKQRLIRYGGLAAMLSGVLYAATFVMAYLIYDRFAEQAKGTFFAEHAFIHLFDTPMFILLLLGAVGLYLRQRSSFGLAGKVGFYVTAFGFLLGAVGGVIIIVIGLTVSDKATMGVPDIIAHMLSHVFYALGSVLLGIATYRAGILPKAAAVMMAIGPASLLAMFMAGFNQSFVLLLPPVMLTALAWMWLGYALYNEQRGPLVQPEPAVR